MTRHLSLIAVLVLWSAAPALAIPIFSQDGGLDAIQDAGFDRGIPGGDMFPNHNDDYIVINLTDNDYTLYSTGNPLDFPNGFYMKYPSFNSSGTRLVLTSRCKIDDVGQPYEIWMMDYDATTQTISNFQQITNNGGTGDIAYNAMCSWSRTNPALLMFLEIHVTQPNIIKLCDVSGPTPVITTMYDPSSDTNSDALDVTNPAFVGTHEDQVVFGNGYNTGNDQMLLFDAASGYPSITISGGDKCLDPSSDYAGTRATYYCTRATYSEGSVFTEWSGSAWVEDLAGFGDPSSVDVPGYWAFYSGKPNNLILSLPSANGWGATGLSLYDGSTATDLVGAGGTDFKWIYGNHNWYGPDDAILFRAEEYSHSGYGNNVFLAIPHPAQVWVDDDWTGPADCGGHAWGYNAFAAIQAGVDAVASSGTVSIANGTYNATTSNSTEWPGHPGEWWFVTIDKSLELIGESRDGVIIDGTALQTENRCTGIWVSASNVTVKNLTIQNFTQTPITAACYALYVMERFRDYTWENVATLDVVTAENVRVTDNMCAFYFMKTEHATIRDCISDNNLGDGVWVAWGCDYATIQGNTVTNSGDHGIWVGKPWFSGPGSNNATITYNTINGAREGGISFVSSDGATIEGNTITNAAGEGWSVGALSLKDGASNVTARYNVIHGNDGTWGGYAGTGHGIGIDGTPSNIVLNWNCIYDNAGYGCYNYSTVTVDAKYCWWGDASGPDTGAKGTGDEVTDYVDFDPWIGKAGTGNIVFLPDPDYFSSTSEARTMVVRYLGGASGPIHSWELLIDRDGTIVGAGNVAAPTSGPFAGGTAIINAVNHPTENKKIVSGTLTTGDAYWGTCDLFRVDYSSVAEGVANIAIEVSYFRSCPFITCDLEGAVGDPGEMRVDLTNPAVSVVEFTNETLTHTNDWVKVGDDGSLIARVVEADPYMTATDFEVNLSGLGLGAAVNPDVATYDSGNGWYDLTWNTFGVTNATVETDLKTLTVTATDGAGHVGTGNDTVTLDNEAPAVPTDLTAAPGHQKTTLGWTHGTDAGQYDGTIVVYTTPYGTYPEYDRPNLPPPPGADPTLAANEGTGYDWGTGTSQVHSITPRDVYRYAAFGRDMARNYSAASDMADATNYWLGDVAGGSSYDGEVETADISALGSSYYKHLDPPYNHECDVAQSAAPQNPLGIPAPDMQIDFEDLMIFALNFGNVSPVYLPAAVSVDSEVGDVALYLQLPDKLAVGSEFTAAVMLKDESGLVQGTHFRVAYFPGVLEFVRASEGALVSGCDAVFFKALEVEDLPDVSAAVLGSGITFGHSGELARLTFRIVGEGDIRLELQDVSARNVLNEELLTYSSDVLVGGGGTEVMIPTQVYLRGNQPNPFTGATTIAFGLPQEGLVRLAIYDVSGRMVRMLINGTLPAAEHVLSWDRRDDSGHAVSGGVYLYRLETSEKTITRKMVVSN